MLDALVSLLLVWAMDPAQFSQIALAQAVVAPCLLLFVSPGTTIYRDFAAWRAQGPSVLARRLAALRAYGWGLGALAVLLSALLAALAPSGTAAFEERFYALVWSFALFTGIHLAGADREFLRLELRLRLLNAINLYQKATLFGGTLLVLLTVGARLEFLAGVAVFSMLSTAAIVRSAAVKLLAAHGASESAIRDSQDQSARRTVLHALKSFSVWMHLSGALNHWVLTLDLFLLGMMQLPAQVTGLYGASLKLANLSLIAPFALTSLFSVWIGRRSTEGLDRDRRELGRLSVLLVLAAAAQALLLAWLAPLLLPWLLGDNWSLDDQQQILRWFYWILAGGAIYSAAPLVGSWISLRAKTVDVFFRVYLPWALWAALLYGWGCWQGDAAAAPDRVARLNVPVTLGLLVLVWLEYWRFTRKAPTA